MRFPPVTRPVFVICALATLASSGCATILQGTKQEVSIASVPTGAQVFVDGEQKGITPMVADLSRKGKHIVAVRLEGYKPYELALTRSVSGWVWGNLVFGGLPGLAVDAITGGLYKLKPDQITATLPAAALLEGTKDAVIVAVVLQADPSWQKIGQMERE